jgi:hypothetical protein
MTEDKSTFCVQKLADHTKRTETVFVRLQREKETGLCDCDQGTRIL